ncbi:MAG: transposase, partial [Deltaproteobacteria bacterium]|nr:transposase [Deltaproteobacteria bacterium]
EPPTGGGRNASVNFRGQKRKNDTHVSQTDPDARLLRKSAGNASRLVFQGYVLMDNRHGLAVDSRLTIASGTAEREAALEMAAGLPGKRRKTMGADKGYDRKDFVVSLRQLNVTPHVARRNWYSAIDERTTRHLGYRQSLCIRKRIEEINGWLKTIAPCRKTKHRGREKVGWMFTFSVAAYNLVRMRNIAVAA